MNQLRQQTSNLDQAQEQDLIEKYQKLQEFAKILEKEINELEQYEKKCKEYEKKCEEYEKMIKQLYDKEAQNIQESNKILYSYQLDIKYLNSNQQILQQKLNDKDNEITKLKKEKEQFNQMYKEIGKDLYKLQSIYTNKQPFKQQHPFDDYEHQPIQYYIKENKKLKEEYKNILGIKESLSKTNIENNQLKEQINQQEKQIETLLLLIQQNEGKNMQSPEQYQKIVQDRKAQKNFTENKFKCCNGKDEIISCRQNKCLYHVNCSYLQFITKAQPESIKCDCGYLYPYSLLRKVNLVEAKCALEQILEEQAQELLQKMKSKTSGFMVYKCPNLFCNFQWCFQLPNDDVNMGQISYCLNCQVIVCSDIIVNE